MAARQESDIDSEIEAEYDIVEHEQAHAVAIARNSSRQSLMEEEEEHRLGQQSPESIGSLSEPFLDSFAGMISQENLQSILKEQSHM